MLFGFYCCCMRTRLNSGMNPMAGLFKGKVYLSHLQERGRSHAAIMCALLRRHFSIWNMAWGGRTSHVNCSSGLFHFKTFGNGVGSALSLEGI